MSMFNKKDSNKRGGWKIKKKINKQGVANKDF